MSITTTNVMPHLTPTFSTTRRDRIRRRIHFKLQNMNWYLPKKISITLSSNPLCSRMIRGPRWSAMPPNLVARRIMSTKTWVCPSPNERGHSRPQYRPTEYAEPAATHQAQPNLEKTSPFARLVSKAKYPIEQRIEDKKRGIGRQKYPIVGKSLGNS